MGEIIKKKKPRALHIVRGRKDHAQKVSCMKESWHENFMQANFIFMHGNLILSCMKMTLLYMKMKVLLYGMISRPRNCQGQLGCTQLHAWNFIHEGFGHNFL